MQFLAEQSYLYNVWTREMQKIKAGPFLQKMLNEWQAKVNSTLKPNKRKLFIYTGHDSTIVNIMHALKIWQRQMPRYSAIIMFELHRNKDTGQYYVEVCASFRFGVLISFCFVYRFTSATIPKKRQK